MDDGLAAYPMHDDERLIRELREAVTARDAFLAVAAHELRNPLTPIAMQVALLLRAAERADPPLPPEFVARLERLERATRRFLKRATVLLDVSRLMAGHQLRPDLSAFALSELVAEIVADHAPLAERVRSPLDATQVTPGVAGTWDRVGVEQILDNLISNALKHGAGAPVAVGLRRLPGPAPGKGQVRLWVRDHGPGIAAEHHERIFGRFQQAGDRTGGGFGVGLWVAREVARGMGGDIAVESRPGHGATFTVFLPENVAIHFAVSKRGDHDEHR